MVYAVVVVVVIGWGEDTAWVVRAATHSTATITRTVIPQVPVAWLLWCPVLTHRVSHQAYLVFILVGCECVCTSCRWVGIHVYVHMPPPCWCLQMPPPCWCLQWVLGLLCSGLQVHTIPHAVAAGVCRILPSRPCQGDYLCKLSISSFSHQCTGTL